MNLKLATRKLTAVGLCAAIGFSVLGFGQAPKASAFTSTTASKIINYGDNYLGTPYRFGASTSTTRYFDCSSFTQYVFKKFGWTLPRTAAQQAKVGRYVAKKNLKKGDLVFFKVPSRGNFIGHVGIYAGNGKMLNTFGAGGVKFTNMNSSYWKENYVTARRLGA